MLELFVQHSYQHVDSRMRCGFVARSCGVGTEPVVIAHMTKSNQNVVGGGGAVRVSSRSCLGRPLRVLGSVYEVIVSYPAGRRMLHVCVDMILSPIVRVPSSSCFCTGRCRVCFGLFCEQCRSTSGTGRRFAPWRRLGSRCVHRR